jgi:hypothetical protein
MFAATVTAIAALVRAELLLRRIERASDSNVSET